MEEKELKKYELTEEEMKQVNGGFIDVFHGTCKNCRRPYSIMYWNKKNLTEKLNDKICDFCHKHVNILESEVNHRK